MKQHGEATKLLKEIAICIDAPNVLVGMGEGRRLPGMLRVPRCPLLSGAVHSCISSGIPLFHSQFWLKVNSRCRLESPQLHASRRKLGVKRVKRPLSVAVSADSMRLAGMSTNGIAFVEIMKLCINWVRARLNEVRRFFSLH